MCSSLPCKNSRVNSRGQIYPVSFALGRRGQSQGTTIPVIPRADSHRPPESARHISDDGLSGTS